MKTYYVAGLPYSDELWHYGTKGMKWGRRLYQNPDGTLTALGKIHYGAKTGAKAAGKIAVKAGKAIARHEVDKFKRKHPWVMSEDELKERTNRVRLEVAYKEALANRSRLNRGKELVRGVLESGFRTLGSRMFNRIGDKLFSEKDSYTDWEAIVKNPSAYSDEDIKKAFDRSAKIAGLKKNSTTINGSGDRKQAKFKDAYEVQETISSNASTWARKTSKGSKFVFEELGSSYGTTSASNAKKSRTTKTGKKYTQKTDSINWDAVYDSMASYQTAKMAKQGKIIMTN